jgi:hypothetical protein
MLLGFRTKVSLLLKSNAACNLKPKTLDFLGFIDVAYGDK